jgi:hypothetical protein
MKHKHLAETQRASSHARATPQHQLTARKPPRATKDASSCSNPELGTVNMAASWLKEAARKTEAFRRLKMHQDYLADIEREAQRSASIANRSARTFALPLESNPRPGCRACPLAQALRAAFAAIGGTRLLSYQKPVSRMRLTLSISAGSQPPLTHGLELS